MIIRSRETTISTRPFLFNISVYNIVFKFFIYFIIYQFKNIVIITVEAKSSPAINITRINKVKEILSENNWIHYQDHKPGQGFEFHSTRNSFNWPNGISKRFDWVIGIGVADGVLERCNYIDIDIENEGNAILKNRKRFYGDITIHPKTVFVVANPYDDYRGLVSFFKDFLPILDQPFVLVSGTNDLTVPRQTDVRYMKSTSQGLLNFLDIINNELLIHWYAENKDVNHMKLSTLPVGLNCKEFTNCNCSEIHDYIVNHNLNNVITEDEFETKTKGVLNIVRVRDGTGQWEDRKRVEILCKYNRLWKEFCHFPPIDGNQNQIGIHDDGNIEFFRQNIRNHTFVLCVHGGGNDPSPKAWEAILLGSIPIIKTSELDDAYKQLPVVIIDNWEEEMITEELLRLWSSLLKPYYTNTRLRQEVIRRLSEDYWFSKVDDKVNEFYHYHDRYDIKDEEEFPEVFAIFGDQVLSIEKENNNEMFYTSNQTFVSNGFNTINTFCSDKALIMKLKNEEIVIHLDYQINATLIAEEVISLKPSFTMYSSLIIEALEAIIDIDPTYSFCSSFVNHDAIKSERISHYYDPMKEPEYYQFQME